MSDPNTVDMDTPNGRESVPAATHRLHGADRSGLGEKGWSEVDEDRVGHPAESNVPETYYEPAAPAPSADAQ